MQVANSFESIMNLAVGGSLLSDQPSVDQPGRDPLVRIDLLRSQLDSVRSAIDTKDGDGGVAEDACANLAELEL
ncbi:hypothetical protein EV175_000019 [Coemansia sp. RSA 1933]|nr:hypothetical protein EV175_000019 [Coemansia sp. RSA 1933]